MACIGPREGALYTAGEGSTEQREDRNLEDGHDVNGKKDTISGNPDSRTASPLLNKPFGDDSMTYLFRNYVRLVVTRTHPHFMHKSCSLTSSETARIQQSGKNNTPGS